MTLVAIGIPGEHYGLWVLRETALVGGLALLVAAGMFFVVQRRRPS